MRVTTPALHINFTDGHAGFYLICGCAVLAAISAIALPWPWRLGAWLGTAIYLGWLWRKPPQRGSLIMSAEGALQIGLGDELPTAAQVLGSTLVSAHLLVLHCRIHNQRKVHYLTLWPDSMPTDDFRRLRVALRWSKGAVAPVPSAKQDQQPF